MAEMRLDLRGLEPGWVPRALDEAGVQYKREGNTILVPADQSWQMVNQALEQDGQKLMAKWEREEDAEVKLELRRYDAERKADLRRRQIHLAKRRARWAWARQLWWVASRGSALLVLSPLILLWKLSKHQGK